MTIRIYSLYYEVLEKLFLITIIVKKPDLKFTGDWFLYQGGYGATCQAAVSYKSVS